MRGSICRDFTCSSPRPFAATTRALTSARISGTTSSDTCFGRESAAARREDSDAWEPDMATTPSRDCTGSLISVMEALALLMVGSCEGKGGRIVAVFAFEPGRDEPLEPTTLPLPPSPPPPPPAAAAAAAVGLVTLRLAVRTAAEAKAGSTGVAEEANVTPAAVALGNMAETRKEGAMGSWLVGMVGNTLGRGRGIEI